MKLASLKTKSLLSRIELVLRKSLRDSALLKDIGETIKNRIYLATKRGNSLVTDSKLNPLSSGYIKYRKNLSKSKNKQKPASTIKTGPFFSPSRSNLTLTGQMLEALTYRTIPTSGQVVVTVKDSSRKDDDLSNLDVAIEVAKNGRPFLGLDPKGVDIIRRKIIADLRRKLKR